MKSDKMRRAAHRGGPKEEKVGVDGLVSAPAGGEEVKGLAMEEEAGMEVEEVDQSGRGLSLNSEDEIGGKILR